MATKTHWLTKVIATVALAPFALFACMACLAVAVSDTPDRSHDVTVTPVAVKAAPVAKLPVHIESAALVPGWDKGGTLIGESIVTWRWSSDENKLASAALLTEAFQKGMNSPFASEVEWRVASDRMVACIDKHAVSYSITSTDSPALGDVVVAHCF